MAELRYGAIIAEWGAPRRGRIEMATAEATVVPVTDALITAVAEMRAACRKVGHPLADRIHANDPWIAASAVHIAARPRHGRRHLRARARSRPRVMVLTRRVVIDPPHYTMRDVERRLAGSANGRHPCPAARSSGMEYPVRLIPGDGSQLSDRFQRWRDHLDGRSS